MPARVPPHSRPSSPEPGAAPGWADRVLIDCPGWSGLGRPAYQKPMRLAQPRCVWPAAPPVERLRACRKARSSCARESLGVGQRATATGGTGRTVQTHTGERSAGSGVPRHFARTRPPGRASGSAPADQLTHARIKPATWWRRRCTSPRLCPGPPAAFGLSAALWSMINVMARWRAPESSIDARRGARRGRACKHCPRAARDARVSGSAITAWRA